MYQYGAYEDERLPQQGAEGGTVVAQLGTGEAHHADRHEFASLREYERFMARVHLKDPEMKPGQREFLSHQAFAPDPELLKQTTAAKLFRQIFGGSE